MQVEWGQSAVDDWPGSTGEGEWGSGSGGCDVAGTLDP